MTALSAEAVSATFTCSLPPKPYPGLRPFEPSEWPIFFGRETMVDDVIGRLTHDRLLVVHGDSGCGKSSLIYAGVLPNLEQTAARRGARWRTCATLPGDQPLWNLARALAGLDGRADEHERVFAMRRILNFGRQGAAALADRLRLDVEDQVCILVDQFEELFAHAKRQGAHEANLLVELLFGIHALTRPGLCAVLTMRSEFFGACAKFPGFAEAVNDTQYLLPRMEHADLVRAIREPATLYDGEVEIGLAERLIADAGGAQDQLPLIQHGLMLLHRRYVLDAKLESTRWKLTLHDYLPSGKGLGALLSDHADEVMQHVGHEHVVEAMFRALTDINSDGTAVRRPQLLSQLRNMTGADEDALRSVVDAFRAEGVSFLRPYASQPLPADARVDLSHEALIRWWRRIADEKSGWLSCEFKDGLVWRSLLVQADSFERDNSNVLSSATTEERSMWLKGRTPAWAERYGGGAERVRKLIDASNAERVRQEQQKEEERVRDARAKVNEEDLRQKARAVRLFRIGFVIVLVLALITGWQAVVANRATERAEAARDEASAALKERTAEALSNDAARQRAESKRAELEQVVASLRQALDTLQRATATAQVNPTARNDINRAQSTIARQVERISTVATPPRIYVHISDESQRDMARQLTLEIEKQKLGDDPIVVPDVRLSKADNSELRCFRVAECEEARHLADIVNKLVVSPKLKLRDMTARYADSTSIRPRHYEAWFAFGTIQLAGMPPAKRKETTSRTITMRLRNLYVIQDGKGGRNKWTFSIKANGAEVLTLREDSYSDDDPQPKLLEGNAALDVREGGSLKLTVRGESEEKQIALGQETVLIPSLSDTSGQQATASSTGALTLTVPVFVPSDVKEGTFLVGLDLELSPAQAGK